MMNNFPIFRSITTFFVVLMAFGISGEAKGFSLQGGVVLQQTNRWDRDQFNNRGLAGTLQWNFENNLLNQLKFAEGKVTPEQLNTAIKTAFNVWETAAKEDLKISDLVKFSQGGMAVEAYPSDGSGIGGGKIYLGTEISIFARPQDYQIAYEGNKNENVFLDDAVAKTFTYEDLSKPKSTGTAKPHNVGSTIVDADIYINSNKTWTLNPIKYDGQNFITHLAHEIGHALGLAHPDLDPYFDTDNNPNNRMNIDPLKPEESQGLMKRNNPAPQDFDLPRPIMVFPVQDTPQLTNDDLSGLNYLYPECPQPTPKPPLKSEFQVQQIDESLGCHDFGDAPDSYRTLLQSDGPRYQEGELQRLGQLWDREPDGQPTPLADGDDLSGGCDINECFPPDDEDGVIFGDSWVDVLFKITRPEENRYQLRAWWDLDRDGCFDHPTGYDPLVRPECIGNELKIDDLLTLDPLVDPGVPDIMKLADGLFKKRYNLGFNPKADGLYSRFRLTWDPLDLDVKPFGEYYSKADCNPTDAAAGNCVSHGEVEDYVHVPEPSSIFGLLAFAGLGLMGLRKKR